MLVDNDHTSQGFRTFNQFVNNLNLMRDKQETVLFSSSSCLPPCYITSPFLALEQQISGNFRLQGQASLPNIKKYCPGFPGGAVVGSLPANAGDTGSGPGLGGSHMPRSDWVHEAQLLSLRVWSLCSETREAAMVRGPRTMMKSGPHLPRLERVLAQRRRPNTAINK